MFYGFWAQRPYYVSFWAILSLRVCGGKYGRMCHIHLLTASQGAYCVSAALAVYSGILHELPVPAVFRTPCECW